MRKTHLSLIVMLIAVLSLTAFISCDNTPKIVTYHVIVKNEDTTVKEKDIADGDSFTLPAKPSDSTRTFLGWQVGDDENNVKQPGEDITITGDITITALWKDFCIVQFDTAGGEKLSSLSIPYGSKINFAGPPEKPTKTGYTFTGWTLNNQPFSFDEEIKENITLTANWTINEYDVSFVLGYESTTSIDSQKIEYNKTAKKPDDPTRTGYIFDGWKVKDGGVFDFVNPITSNTVLVAQWSEIKTNFILLFPKNVNYVDTLVVQIGSQEKEFKYSEGTADGDYLKYTTTVNELDYGDYTITVETKDSDGNKVGTSHFDTLVLNSLTTDKEVKVDKSVIVNVEPTITATASTVSGTYEGYTITGTLTFSIVDGVTLKYSTDGKEPTTEYTAGDKIDIKNGTQIAYALTYSGNNWTTGKTSYSGKIDKNIEINTIGATGPAGGIIFYDEKTVRENEYTDSSGILHTNSWRFFEAAPADLSKNYPFGGKGKHYGTSSDRGKGKENAEILKAMPDYSTSAAAAAASYSYGGFADWYVPSAGELTQLLNNKAVVSGLNQSYYWSSTEKFSYNEDMHLNYAVPNEPKAISDSYVQDKSTAMPVRVVRSF